MALLPHPGPHPIVGRTRERAQLRECLTAAQASHGRAVLVGGEAGIGKSHLIGATMRDAEGRGMLVLQGRCFEPDRALPFAPVLDLLRAYFAPKTAEEIAAHLGPLTPEFAHLLPDLAQRLPGLAALPLPGPPPDRRRLFHALATFAAQLATDRSAAVVAIEDMHWSDDASLEFLLFLARRLSGQPILLLLTYRSDEIEPGLRHFLAEIDRGRFADELVLERLTADEVAAMLQAILVPERPLHPDVVAAIHEITDGNPFFVEEVLKSLLALIDLPDGDSGWEPGALAAIHVPRSVQDAVLRRAARLRPTSRRLLAVAAIAGRRFDVSLLQAVTGCTEAVLLAAIKELTAAHLVVEESADVFAFRHALTRQAVVAELLARERRALHRMMAEALERDNGSELDAHLSDLAYHHFEAAHWAKALHFGRLAGESAQRLHAPRAAIEHLTRGLQAAYHLSGTLQLDAVAADAPPLAAPADLYRERAASYEVLGDFERARADLETALRLARAAGDNRIEWAALLDLGSLWRRRDYARSGEFLRHAAELSCTLSDERMRARSLNLLGNWLANVGQGAEAAAAHEEALARFTTAGDEQGTAETLDLFGIAVWLCFGDGPRAVALLDRALALYRSLEDAQGLISCLITQAAVVQPLDIAPLEFSSDSRRAHLQTLTEARRLAQKVDWRAGQAFAEYGLGRTWSGCGDLGKAREHALEAVRLASEIDHAQWLAASSALLGQLHALMFAPDAAIPHLETGLALARSLGSAWWIGMNAGYLALAHLWRGDAARAESVLRAGPPANHAPRTLGERWAALAWAELALAQGQPAETLRIAEQVLAAAPAPASGRSPPGFQRLQGEALLALRRLDEAEEALLAARHAVIDADVPPFIWPVQRAVARLRLSQRRYAEARRECAAARETIERLAATIDDLADRERFIRAAVASLPSVPMGKPPSPRRAEAARFGGLTARERAVAAQIGLGKSNAEIGATLFISERTVASHITHMLDKLCFSSRAQIAVWAGEHALLPARDIAPQIADVQPGAHGE